MNAKDLSIDKSQWTQVAFGDVMFEPKESTKDPVADGIKHVVGLEHIESENIHLTQFATLEESTTFRKKFAVDDVLFGRRRAYLKKAAQAKFSGICSGDITVFRTKENLLPELLPFIVQNQAFFDYAIKHSAGGLSPRVKFKDLAKYQFLLPPKDQQAQLAKLLWAMDEVIEREKEVLMRTRSLKDRFFESFINSSKGDKIKLDEILIPLKNKSKVPHQLKKYIGLEHIQSGEYSTNKFDDSASVKAQCNIVQKGDLCYSKLRPYLDKAIIAPFDAVSTTELLIYNTRKVSKEYILHYFHSQSFLKYISSQGFGTKMPRVNQSIIGDFEILLPNNEEVILSQMQLYLDSIKGIYSKISSSQALQKSLINQIFS